MKAALRWRGRLSGLRGLPWGRAPLACLDYGLARKQNYCLARKHFSESRTSARLNLGRGKGRDGLGRKLLPALEPLGGPIKAVRMAGFR